MRNRRGVSYTSGTGSGARPEEMVPAAYPPPFIRRDKTRIFTIYA